MRLSDVMYSSTRTPIGMEVNRLRESENAKYGHYLLSMYGKDPFASYIVESVFERHPLMLMEFQELGGFGILKEDAGSFLKGRGDASGMEYKGGIAGFMKNVGDRGKSILAGIGLKTYALTSAMGFHKDDEALQDEYNKMLAKYETSVQHNLLTIDKKIRGAIPDFPNNDKDDTKNVKAEDIGMKSADLEKATPHAVFLNGLGLIAAAYDGVVASHKSKNPQDQISTAQANIIIDDLRVMLVKYSGELSSVYTQVENNEKMKLMPLLFEADEAPASGGKKDVAAGGAAELRGASKAGADTEQTKANKSKVLPAVLAALGLGAIAASVVVGSPWFASLFEKTRTVTTPEQTREAVTGWQEETIATVTRENGGNGIMSFLNGMVPGTKLSAAASPKEFVDAVSKLGGGDYATGLQSLTQGGKGVLGQGVPGTYDTLIKLGDNPNVYGNTFGDVIKHAGTGTHKTVGDMLQMDVGKITKIVPIISRVIVPATTTVVAGGALIGAGTLAFVSTALMATGVGLVVAGAAIYFLREKGLKSSRSAAIQGLKDIMVDVEERPDEKPGGGQPSPAPSPAPPPSPSPSLKSDDKVVVWLSKDKTNIGWGDDNSLLAAIPDGKTLELDSKDTIKVDTSDDAVTTKARKTLLRYIVQDPRRVNIKKESGLKDNDFSAITDACLKLGVTIVRFDDEGNPDETEAEGIDEADIPDEVVDAEKEKKKKGDAGDDEAPTTPGGLARVDLSMKDKATGIGAGGVAAEGHRSLVSTLFEDVDEGAEVRRIGDDPDDPTLPKKWTNIGKKVASGGPLTKDVPRVEDTFFNRNKIDKKAGTGLNLDTYTKATVAGGINAIRNKAKTKNVSLGFDNSTAAALKKVIGVGKGESVGAGGKLSILLKVYANSKSGAPEFAEYLAAFKKAKKGIKDKDELKRILVAIGMVKSGGKDSGKGSGSDDASGKTSGTPKKTTNKSKSPTTTQQEDDLNESVIMDRWLLLAGIRD